jgi:hypothetical protein
VQQQAPDGQQWQPQTQRLAQAQAPLLVTGKVPLSAAYHAHVEAGTTPRLGVLLLHIPAGASLGSVLGYGAAARARQASSGMHLHVIDMLGFDPEKEEVSEGQQACRAWLVHV